MRGGFAFSVGFHALMLFFLLFGLPFFKIKPREMPPMISVELVDMGKETTTNKISTANKVVKEPQEETPAPPPKPQPSAEPNPTPPAPPEPKPREALNATVPKLATVSTSVPELEAPDVNLKKKLPPLPDLAAVDSKVPGLAAPNKVDLTRPKPKPPTESFDNVLKNLTKTAAQPPTTQPPSPDVKAPAKPATGAQAPLSANLTASEMDAVRQQLNGCMNWPDGAISKANLVIQLDVTVNPDRTVASARIVDQDRMANDTIYAASARAALRAVRMSQCNPLNLPSDKYQLWQQMTVNLTPPQ